MEIAIIIILGSINWLSIDCPLIFHGWSTTGRRAVMELLDMQLPQPERWMGEALNVGVIGRGSTPKSYGKYMDKNRWREDM
jgi:hypothetical protein